VVFHPRSANLDHELVRKVDREQPRLGVRAEQNRDSPFGAHAYERVTKAIHQPPAPFLIRVPLDQERKGRLMCDGGLLVVAIQRGLHGRI
jgi:hypothetical protein